jgi:peptidoglycan/xylan/chitin deacetylase (PgdA/CDA1 family)
MATDRPLTRGPVPALSGPEPRIISITLDDVPLQPLVPGDVTLPSVRVVSRITLRIIDALHRAGAGATAFVNEGPLRWYPDVSDRVAILRLWLDGGVELGNHTWSHSTPESTPFDEYCRDVVRGETLLRPLMAARGMPLRYFRHPQLHTGPSPDYMRGLDRFLVSRGYVVAPVTIKHHGWRFAVAYAAAKSAGNAEIATRVGEAYVAYILDCLVFFERMSDEVFGREIRHVLLLHVSELNGDYLDVILQAIAKRQYSFVSLHDVLQDPAYGTPVPSVAARGPSWLHRWALTMGRELPPEPREPPFVTTLFNEACTSRLAPS